MIAPIVQAITVTVYGGFAAKVIHQTDDSFGITPIEGHVAAFRADLAKHEVVHALMQPVALDKSILDFVTISGVKHSKDGMIVQGGPGRALKNRISAV